MITSSNLCSIAFQSNTDSTRLQMASKQIQQALTHPNCEVPYVVGEDYYKLTKYSPLGICIAEENGSVIYKNDDIMVIKYDDIDKIDIKNISKFMTSSATYANQLRNSLNQQDIFKKGDIIYEYDCFNGGVPTCGYNAFTAYNIAFGFNHEDAIVISESFADKARVTFKEKVFLPIYEFTLLDPIYNDPGGMIYFPGVGQKVKRDVVCQYSIPKSDGDYANSQVLKQKMINIFKNMSLAEFNCLAKNGSNNNKFQKKVLKTKVEDGTVTGFKIHRLYKDRKLLDCKLQNALELMYAKYNDFIVEIYTKMTEQISHKFATQLLRKYYVYSDNSVKRKELNVKDIIYILEFEITKEEPTKLGDKLTNMYAGKGVCSLILPDELCPIAINTNKKIDLLFNPFGVYSRMNLGQVVNGSLAKTVMLCDQHIRSNPESVKEVLTWLNNNIVKYLKDDSEYYNRISNLITKLDDTKFKNEFINDVIKRNLYIEGPCFAHTNMYKLQENWIEPNEPVKIKKDLITYIRQKLKLKNDFVFTDDIIRNSIFCVPIYTTKLYKLTDHIINARDVGPVKEITQQPLKGRSHEGGSRLGYTAQLKSCEFREPPKNLGQS